MLAPYGCPQQIVKEMTALCHVDVTASFGPVAGRAPLHIARQSDRAEATRNTIIERESDNESVPTAGRP
jgi:hypothetical protein